MADAKKDWRSAKQADRTRKKVGLTLSDNAREALDSLAEQRGESKSEVIESLILGAFARSKK